MHSEERIAEIYPKNQHILYQLGENIRLARMRRKYTQPLIPERSGIKHLAVITLFFSILSAPSLVGAKDTDPEIQKWKSQWAFEREDDGITSECRTHISDIEQCKLTVITDDSVAALTEINVDSSNLSSWSHNIKTVRRLEGSSGKYDYRLLMTHLFTGALDRWSITHTTVDRDPKTGEVMLVFKLDNQTKEQPHYIKDNVVSEHVRFKYLAGYWKFTPLENGKTKIVYSSIGQPGGYVQKFMTPLYNIGALDTLYETVKKLLIDVKDAKYQKATLDAVPLRK